MKDELKGKEVTLLQWNPGENILLALYKNNRIVLYSTETYTKVIAFEK